MRGFPMRDSCWEEEKRVCILERESHKKRRAKSANALREKSLLGALVGGFPLAGRGELLSQGVQPR